MLGNNLSLLYICDFRVYLPSFLASRNSEFRTVLYWTVLHGNTQNARLHTLQSSSIRLCALPVSWATPSTCGTAISCPISDNPASATLQLPTSCHLPKPTVTSKWQPFFRGKWSIYCHIYVFPSYLTSVNYQIINSCLFFNVSLSFHALCP